MFCLVRNKHRYPGIDADLFETLRILNEQIHKKNPPEIFRFWTVYIDIVGPFHIQMDVLSC